MAEGDIPPSEKVSADANLNGNNGLLLYSYHHCFYTQKVLMALYEKKIPFSTKLIDITKKEQYQLWYLKINPKGEVPVLKDGIKYIPDSERIIQYLEDNFSNGEMLLCCIALGFLQVYTFHKINIQAHKPFGSIIIVVKVGCRLWEHSRLIPIDQGLEVKQKVIKFHNDIDNIPANILTLGSLFNNEYCSNLKYPFFLPSIRRLLKATEKSGGEALRNLARTIPEYRDNLLQKAIDHDKRRVKITDKDEFFKVLQQVDDLLETVEDELSAHDKDQLDWWLCLDRFTIADISLTILLDRLSRVGLENYFWGKGKRPNVDKYYRRVQKRDSYKKTIPSFMTDLSIILKSNAPIVLGVSLLTVLTVVVGSFFYFKK